MKWSSRWSYEMIKKCSFRSGSEKSKLWRLSGVCCWRVFPWELVLFQPKVQQFNECFVAWYLLFCCVLPVLDGWYIYSAVCYHRCNCCDKHLQVPTATIRCLLGGWRGLEGPQSGRRSPQSSPNCSILPTVDYAPCQRAESCNLQPIVA